VLFLRTGNLVDGKVSLDDVKYITQDFHSKLSKSRVLPKDVLVSRVGLTGSAALVPDEFPESNCANIIIIRANIRVLPQYLHAYINGPVAAQQNKGFTAGSVQAVLNIGAIKRLKILVPPLIEQKKIAAILGSVDEAIGATRAVIEQTRRVKQGLLQQLLTRGIGHTRFKQTEIGEIPEAWEVVELDDVIHGKPTNGRSPKASNVPPGTPTSIQRMCVGFAFLAVIF
jgi:type I restriction enzyme S subunit